MTSLQSSHFTKKASPTSFFANIVCPTLTRSNPPNRSITRARESCLSLEQTELLSPDRPCQSCSLKCYVAIPPATVRSGFVPLCPLFCSSLVSLSISSDGDAALIRASCSNPSTSKGIQYGAGCSRSAYPCQRCKLRPANNRFVAAASSPCFEPGGQLPHGTGDEI